MSSSSSSSCTSINIPYWSRWQTVKLVLIGCLLSFITNFPSSFLHTSVNTAVGALDFYVNGSYANRKIEIDEDQHTWIKAMINNCWFVGQFVGALFSPKVCDKFGRKPAYLLATGVMTFACALQMAASVFPYPEILIVGRTLAASFSPMSDAVAILYLQEISPTHLRGTLSSLFATGYSFMALFGLILGTDSVLGHSLSWLLFVPVVPGLLSLIFLAYLPETPKFLIISKKNLQAAKHSLCFYQGDTPRNDLVLSEYQFESSETVESTKARLWDLILVPYLRQAMLLTFMVLTLCLPFYPILQCSTTFLRLMSIDELVLNTVILVIVDRARSPNQKPFELTDPNHNGLFESIGEIALKSYRFRRLSQYFSSLIGVLMAIGCLIAPLMLKRFKRRTLLFCFGWGSTLFIMIFALSGGWLRSKWENAKYGALIGLLGYIVCWSVSVGPISYFIGPELVPLQYRSMLFCVGYSLNNIFIAITNVLALKLFKSLGSPCFIPLFVIPSTIALIYIQLYLPETKNKEIPVIVETLKSGRRKVNAMSEFI